MNKIRILTVEELNQLIESNLVKINEIDIKTLSCNQNVSIEAAQNIQNGNKIKEINQNRSVADDSQVAKAGELLSRTVQSFLNQYKDIKFMFFTYKRLGNLVHLLFSVENVKKLIDGVAILSGEVSFGNEQLKGNIHIDFPNNKVYYKHKGSNYKYVLEPDVRTLEIWTSLLKGLQNS